jgi:xanthine dehydrogenase FAD-binding subunit
MTDVFLPETMDDLWVILGKHESAVVYAGGTDLLVKKRQGLVRSNVLVCLERLKALRSVCETGDHLFIGAGATHSQLLRNVEVRKGCPVLVRALSVIGSPSIRNMGTIGGNVVTASPAGDSLPALHVLDSEVEIRCQSGCRRVTIGDFVRGPGDVDLKSGEIVSGIWLRKTPDFHIHYYEKVGLRSGLACAVASMAALVRLSENNIIEKIRLAWGSVGPKIVIQAQVESLLEGRPLSADSLKRVVPLIEESVTPIDDLRAGADYRRMVAGSLIFRLLAR